MKKILLFIFALFIFGGFSQKAQAFSFEEAYNPCEKYIDVPNSTLPSGPFSAIYKNKLTLTWLPVSGASSYKIYKTPSGGSESLAQTAVVGQTYATGFFVGPTYHVYQEITSMLQDVKFRVEAYNAGGTLIDQTPLTGSFGGTCAGLFTFESLNSLSANNITISAPGVATTQVDHVYSYYGIKRNFALSVDSIKNSSGVEVLNAPTGISSAGISFSPTSVLDNGNSSTLSLTIPSALPTGVYTVKVAGIGPRIGGTCGGKVSGDAGDYFVDVLCQGDFADDMDMSSVSVNTSNQGNTYINSKHNQYKTDYCGAGNFTTVPGGTTGGNDFFCNTPQNLAKIYTTFTITYTAPSTPSFDYKLETPSNGKISASGNKITTITGTKTTGSAQSVQLSLVNLPTGIPTSSFSTNPFSPNAVATSDLTLTASPTIAPGLYTIFAKGSSNTSVASGFTSSGVTGTCTGSYISSGMGYTGIIGSNVLDCSVNGVRTINSVLSGGYGVSAWNSTSATDASSQFTAHANTICGAGNWTSATSPLSFGTNNTTETFSCTTIPSIANISLDRTVAYQLFVDPYNLGLSDGPSDGCATPVSSSINLAWDKVSTATNGYKIYRSSDSGVNYSLLTTVIQPSSGTSVSYTDSAITAGYAYSYYIVGIDASNTDMAQSDAKARISYNPPVPANCGGTVTDPLSGTCTQSIVANKPRWTAQISGGTTPYSYAWVGTDGVVTGAHGESFTSHKSLSGGDVTAPTVTVTDGSHSTVSPVCADAVGGTSGAAKLKLVLTQKRLDDSNYERDGVTGTMKVKKDENVSVYLGQNNIDFSTCTYSNDLKALTGINSPTGFDKYQNTKLDTSHSQPDPYVLTVFSCRSTTGNPVPPSSVKLIVTGTASLEEF